MQGESAHTAEEPRKGEGNILMVTPFLETY